MSDAYNLSEYNGCDTTTLARTENPQTSKDAAEKLVKSGELNRQENWLYGIIVEYNKLDIGDFTTKDIASYMTDEDTNDYFQWYDICRKRFSGLRDKGKIELVGGDRCLSFVKRRDGCRVWRLK